MLDFDNVLHGRKHPFLSDFAYLSFLMHDLPPKTNLRYVFALSLKQLIHAILSLTGSENERDCDCPSW